MLIPLVTGLLLATACPAEPHAKPAESSETAGRLAPSIIRAWLDVKDTVVSTGFRFPGSAFRKEGCEVRSRKGQVLKALSHALVVRSDANMITLEATAFRNHRRHLVQVQLLGTLKPFGTQPLRVGDLVKKGQKIATAIGPFEVKVFVDGEQLDASTFLQRWSTLFDPTREKRLVVVHQASREMLFREGGRDQIFKVGFGQSPGQKTERGDNKSPRGMYFVVQHHRGTFGGPSGEYYGGHWIKINYPNRFDAERGLHAGFVNRKEADKIAASWQARKLTDQSTKLGSGIGFHGWIDEWSNSSPWLSWGCLVMHNTDIAGLYADLPLGMMVVLM